MCTKSEEIVGNVSFDSNVSATTLTSAIFKVDNIINFLAEYPSAEFIIVKSVPGVNENDTLRMWLIDDEGNPIPFTTPIYATFPCPDQCVTTLKKVCDITPLARLEIPDRLARVFCVSHLRELIDYINNQPIQNGGIAFNTMNNGSDLGMYTVRINHYQYTVTFNRFWSYSLGHPAFKAV